MKLILNPVMDVNVSSFGVSDVVYFFYSKSAFLLSFSFHFLSFMPLKYFIFPLNYLKIFILKKNVIIYIQKFYIMLRIK